MPLMAKKKTPWPYWYFVLSGEERMSIETCSGHLGDKANLHRIIIFLFSGTCNIWLSTAAADKRGSRRDNPKLHQKDSEGR